jgi:hypothetical protein
VTAVPHPLATIPAGSDRGLQRRRRIRVARTRVGLSVQTRLLPTGGERRRQRLEVCGAANTLTALGARVRVVQPSTPWPRSPRAVVTDTSGWVADLAVATALRGERVYRYSDAPSDVPLCPLMVCFRVAGRPGYLPADQLPTAVAELAALRGLVIEVHLLEPIPPA